MWQCDTDLPTGFRLGKVEVSCEGWSRPGDKHVLQGTYYILRELACLI